MAGLGFMGDINTMFPGQKGGPGQFLGFTPTFEKTTKSGAFKQVGKVGQAYSDLLLDRLSTAPGDTETFRLMSEAEREQLDLMGATAKDQLGDRAVASGAFDSGQLLDQGQSIDRAKLQAFSASIRQILIDLEDRRTEGVLQFLGGSAQEHLGVQGMDFAKESGRAAAERENLSMVLDFFSAGGGGAMAICWVAAATFNGWSDPRTHFARFYILNLGPKWFLNFYAKYGERVAAFIKPHRLLRAAIRPLFTYFAWRGRR